MKNLLTPFGEVNKYWKIGISLFWVAIVFLLFEIFHGPIFPSPSKVIGVMIGHLQSMDFYENLVASIFLTMKAMGISIIITVLIVYASSLPLFSPIATVVSKCRYLTLTGLLFTFVMVSDNISDTKLYLLLFGIVPFFVTSFIGVVNNPNLQEIQKGYVNKLGRWGTLYEVIVIGKADVLIDVMRQNFAISWMMITFVEGYAMTDGGIGTMMIKSNKYLNLAPVFAILLEVLLLGLLFDYLLSRARVTLFPHVKNKK